MVKTVLWLAGIAVLILAALFLSRGLGERAERPKEVAPAVEKAAQPAAAKAPEAPKPVEVAPPEPAPATQVDEDAAAVGMTTREPTEEEPPPPEEPPTRP